MKKDKKLSELDYFDLVFLAEDIEQRKGKIYWLYKYVILTLQMYFYLYLDRFKNAPNQHRFGNKFDRRCMYKMFLKGYVLNYSELNQPW